MDLFPFIGLPILALTLYQPPGAVAYCYETGTTITQVTVSADAADKILYGLPVTLTPSYNTDTECNQLGGCHTHPNIMEIRPL
ncbi:MAG: hypothetical protein GY758_00970 [Fuerstiella sp.]|nr:hypothetical protein [Fuerstiella sp.]